MKKIFIDITTSILSIIFILSVVSCSKDQSKSGVTGVSSEKIRITGADANTITKTTLNGLVTSWNAGDKVGIYSPDARPTPSGAAGVTNRQFSAGTTAFSSAFTAITDNEMYWGTTTPHQFYAYYPYSASAGAVATLVPITLAAAQTQSAGNSTAHIGNYDFMVATPVTGATPGTAGEATTVNLRYNHVFSILEFQIKRSSGSAKITKIKLTAPTTNLILTSGTINITQSTPGDGVAYTIAGGTGSKEITLTITGGVTPTADYATTPKIYMMILPGDFSAESMTIGLEYESSGVFENTAKTGKIFERGKKYVVQMDVPIVTDVDNNVYNTVTIGTQVWMASNLKTTKYNDGSSIQYVNTDWSTSTAGAYYYYGNVVSNGTTYGALYNWYAVDNNDATKVASNGGKNICPTGWHVPTDGEWTTLTNYLVDFAGGKLKETGTTHWTTPNSGATNSSGFTALPGGNRNWDGFPFYKIGYEGWWWSSSPEDADPSSAYCRRMRNTSSVVESGSGYKTFGFSVRCVKD